MNDRMSSASLDRRPHTLRLNDELTVVRSMHERVALRCQITELSPTYQFPYAAFNLHNSFVYITYAYILLVFTNIYLYIDSNFYIYISLKQLFTDMRADSGTIMPVRI